MTNEELEDTIRDVCEGIDRLSAPDRTLTKEEKNEKKVLLFQRQVLDGIKDAKARNRRNDELRNTMVYNASTSWLGKHPLLLAMAVNLKFRNSIL